MVEYHGRGAGLEITFRTGELRDYDAVPATAFTRYGPALAQALALRFADLRALQDAVELEVFGAEVCVFEGNTALKIPLTNDHSLVLVTVPPKRRTVPRIKILAIVGPQ